MNSEDSTPGRDITDPWLTDKVVSYTSGPEISFARDRDAILPNRDEAYLRIQFVRVFVRDQERSMRFFIEQLGFQLLFDVRFASGNRWIEVAPPTALQAWRLFCRRKRAMKSVLSDTQGLSRF